MKVDLNVLGLFSLKTEDIKFWQLLILLLIGAVIVLAVIYLLKVYALPVLSVPGIAKGAGSILRMFKSRAP